MADPEKNGGVDYRTFINTIFELKRGDSSMLLAMMRFKMHSSQESFEGSLRRYKNCSHKVICSKVSSLGSHCERALCMHVQTCDDEDVHLQTSSDEDAPQPSAGFHLIICAMLEHPCIEIRTELSIDRLDTSTDMPYLYNEDLQTMMDLVHQ